MGLKLRTRAVRMPDARTRHVRTMHVCCGQNMHSHVEKQRQPRMPAAVQLTLQVLRRTYE